MRALAVSGSSRLKSAPNVPTVAESGFPGFEASQWYGILVPAGTPETGGGPAQHGNQDGDGRP